MKNSINLIIAGLLVLIFGLFLFMFQVRQTEVAVVTFFGRPVRDIVEPGAYFKWPWPIERVHRFDKRINNFQDPLEATFTSDDYTLLVQVYAGWTISEPKVFFPRFGRGATNEAARSLEVLIRSAKTAVVGQHPFAHFISAQENELKLEVIEKEILAQIQQKAREYGIDVKFLGIHRLALPPNVTQAVFDRMKSEREYLVSKIETDGRREANNITASANSNRISRLSEANQKVEQSRGEAQAKTAEAFRVMEQNPELASLLLKLRALESATNRTTYIFDANTVPFNVLREKPTEPAKAK